MNTKSIATFAAGALSTAGVLFLIASGPEHEHKGMDSAAQPESDGMMEMSPEDMMAAMTKLATPNEHHAELAKTIGNWTAKSSFNMDPAAPPMEGEGTMSVEWVLGGRYTHSNFKMEFMGQPFEGIGYTGYDIAHEQYIATWADTMSTTIFYMTGNETEPGIMEMHGTSTTPMGDTPMKIVTSWTDANTWVDKFYDQMPDGTWFNSGTITYTRY